MEQLPDSGNADISGERDAQFTLESYDEAQLEREAIQAESAEYEERAAALRDRDTCILSAPAGTAPPRVLAPVPTVQNSLWRPLEMARALREQAKAERRRRK